MTPDPGFLERALELAEQARGRTSPNPMVGAVLVKDGEIIAEGYHQEAGKPHAEVLAIEAAGDKAEGSTLYVTLEPCCHHGRTPPCVPAIMQAGIKRVVVGMVDPFPAVNGLGLKLLAAAGVEVFLAHQSLQERCARLNEVFIKYVTTNLPFVTMKYAMSLDGKTATASRQSQWISGEAAREWVHHKRNIVDAVLIGAGTVLTDNPRLTCRLPDGRNPVRIVADSRARTPLDARILDGDGRVLIAVTSTSPTERINALQRRGAEVVVLPDRQGRVRLSDLMKYLAWENITHVLLEGGGTLNAAAVEEGVVDRVVAFIAPIFLGGETAPTPLEGLGVPDVGRAWSLQDVEWTSIGRDVQMTGYLKRPWPVPLAHAPVGQTLPEPKAI